MFKAHKAVASPQIPLQLLLNSDDFLMEEKLDGCRMLLYLQGTSVTAYNRNGVEAEVPRELQDIVNPVGLTALDGEWFEGAFHVFDMPIFNNVSYMATALRSRVSAVSLFVKRIEHPSLKPVDKYWQAIDKLDAYHRLEAQRAEGVIFKQLSSRYVIGKSDSWIKRKFYKTADVVVMELERKGKRQAVTIGVYENGQLREVSGLKLAEGLLDKVKVGSVLEVRYLYPTEELKLYIPTFSKIRTDKRPEDCTLDQIVIELDERYT